MFALAINGSPRKNGNTHTLLEKVLAPLRAAGWETELVQVAAGTSAAASPATSASRTRTSAGP